LIHSFWLLPVLFVTGLIAGLIDSIAGGGGLLTLPVLLGLGLPPKLALGTNKFQSSFGSFTASLYFTRHKVVELSKARVGIISTFIGAAVGTWLVQQIDPSLLNNIIPILLGIIAVYTFFTPDIGKIDQHPRISSTLFYILAGILLGFYDGFFGPGVGSFWAVLLVLGLGLNLTKATGYTKVMNFTSNIVSLLVFLMGGFVWFTGGISMGIGQMIGAKIGSNLAIRKGTKFIRAALITIVILTIIKLLYSRFG
jgi:uncharacterized protein